MIRIIYHYADMASAEDDLEGLKQRKDSGWLRGFAFNNLRQEEDVL